VTGSSTWDLRSVLVTPATQFLPWLAAVVLVTWAGYPGVVCVTPLAWLIAARVGLLVMSNSTSQTLRRRYEEAAVAGCVLGLLQGLLLIGVMLLLLPMPDSERSQSLLFGVILTLAGVPAGAASSLLTAWLVAHRLDRS